MVMYLCSTYERKSVWGQVFNEIDENFNYRRLESVVGTYAISTFMARNRTINIGPTFNRYSWGNVRNKFESIKDYRLAATWIIWKIPEYNTCIFIHGRVDFFWEVDFETLKVKYCWLKEGIGANNRRLKPHFQEWFTILEGRSCRITAIRKDFNGEWQAEG